MSQEVPTDRNEHEGTSAAPALSPLGKLFIIVALVAAVIGGAVYWGDREPPPQEVAAVKPPVMPENDSAPPIRFEQVAGEEAQLAPHFNGAAGQKLLPEAMGGGVAFFDYDADGDPDLLLVSGTSWPWDEPAAERQSSLRLYRNDGGSFAEVTKEAGLTADFYAVGIAVGDVDADGDDDLFVTSTGQNHLYRNTGQGFEDATQESGLGGEADAWTTSAGFFDYDRDGDLDLFVCNYVRWSREIDLAADYRLVGVGRSYGPPFNFGGSQSFLYRNDGGRFSDVSESAGIHVLNESTDVPVGKALAVTFHDVDLDGWLDILVANDTVRNFLFHNQADGTFREEAQFYGFAYDSNGGATGAMGIDTAWFRNDEDLAVAIGNFANEMTSFYVSQTGNALFTDEAIASGVGGPTRKALTFGVLLEDFDLDGRVDLVQANGHLEEDIKVVQASQDYQQPAQLFWNAGSEGRHDFVEVPAELTGDLATPVVGRALASADIDADGDLDLVLTQVNGPPLLLRNAAPENQHWLRCQLNAGPGNPHAIGAVVEVSAGGMTQRRTIMPTRSYLSQCEPVATFGLGVHDSIDEVKIIWPDGVEQTVESVEVDQVLSITHSTESFAELANKGKALLENGRFEESLAVLQAANAQRPREAPLLRNLARAYLLGGQPTQAIEVLEKLRAESVRPDPASIYLTGIAAMRLSDYEVARSQLTEVVRLAPESVTAHFQLATAELALGNNETAEEHFQRAAEIDPLHGGAQFQLATFARKRGDRDTFAKLMRDFERIRALKGSIATDAILLESCDFTKAEDAVDREPASRVGDVAAPMWQVSDLGQSPETEAFQLRAAAVLSMNAAERYHLAGIDSYGELLVLAFDAEGNLSELARADEPLLSDVSAVSLVVGNAVVDASSQNTEADDWPEILIVSPEGSWLYRFDAVQGFTDLSEQSGLSAAQGHTARWVDLDHDGDLDVCVLNEKAIQAWRNNGDGTFEEATEYFQLAEARAGTDFVAIDLNDANTSVDLVIAAATGTQLQKNLYAGRFETDEVLAAAWGPAEKVVADDFDNDGTPDVWLCSANRAAYHDPFGQARQEFSLELETLLAVGTIDYDNDGWLDLVLAGEVAGKNQLMLFRNQGGEFVAQPEVTELDLGLCDDGLLDLDADGDGDSDLLLLGDFAEVRLLRNETETENRQLKLALHSYVGQPSSIGVRVEARRGEFLASRWSQRELPLEIGIGEHDQLDSIQSLWGNGVLDNQIEIAVTEHPVQIIIFELVRTGSCPFLYAWIDQGWQFVTDLLGTAPLNVAVARDVGVASRLR